MCGSGRFLVPLLERGFDMDGTDASPEMLAACRRRCAERGLNPSIELQPLQELSMRRRYALAMIPAGSFELVERRDAGQALARLYEHLRPGGRLVLEAHARRPDNPWSGPWGGRWVSRPDGAKIIISWLGQYDPVKAEQRSVHRYDLVQDGRLIETEFEDFGGPVYDREELTALLHCAGFTEVQYLKLYAMTEPEDDAEIAYVATRP
jgi:SAM-dependent methyltransferase